MTFSTLPTSIDHIDARDWSAFDAYFRDLLERDVSPANQQAWLADWSQLSALLDESGSMIYIQKALDTTDKEKEESFLAFIQNVVPKATVADQALKERFLLMETSEEVSAGLETVIRNMQNQADLFRDENVPLQTKLRELGNEYDKITGAMSAEFDGQEKNLNQLRAHLTDKDRDSRELAWKTIMDLWQEGRDQLNAIYAEMLAIRHQVAINAGMDNFRDYIFRNYDRFDYTPVECFTFHEAIETVVVPAAARIYEKKRRRLGLDSLKPWDVDVDPSDDSPLKPYAGQDELIQKSLNIFEDVDPVLARHFAVMADENLLDLETRMGKALGGFCSTLSLRERPYIFMNGVGTHDDVQTLLHEGGHAFHVFESADLPYIWQKESPMEFAEVASMSMELLSAPYLTKMNGGFYTDSEAARARIEHLEKTILFLPYMAVVDAFQHWVYENPEKAKDSDQCDTIWGSLWQRFMPGVDYSGWEGVMESGWHRKLHIFQVPFYYIEYGMAQIGALQVWRNALQDQAGAVRNYRHALSLGGTKTLPELFAAAGAEFRFDTAMLSELMALVEKTIEELESAD